MHVAALVWIIIITIIIVNNIRNVIFAYAVSDAGTDYVLVRTELGSNSFYQLLYCDIAYYLFSFIVPLLLLAVFNTRLILTYRGVASCF